MKASLIIIGNEILSGRTQDKNLSYLANWLNEIGIQLAEVRVIRDEEEIVVETVNYLRSTYDYVFTTGGIGPTHDDITSLCIAKAFGVELEINSGALGILKEYYKDGELTDARMKMTKMPVGSELIENPVSRAPGFKMDNVFVLAGIPSIMQGMLEGARKHLTFGEVVKSKSIDVFTPESNVADALTDLQNKYAEVEIGSYPFNKDNRFGTSVVMRSSDEAKLKNCESELKELMKNYDTKY
jgi:molybdenum cofactor synthesis domain-containing protein